MTFQSAQCDAVSVLVHDADPALLAGVDGNVQLGTTRDAVRRRELDQRRWR